MKSILPKLALLSALAGTSLAAQGWARYLSSAPDGVLWRWSYEFSGVSEDNWGQDFLNAIRGHGGITHNWQAWPVGDGTWRFDVSEIATITGDTAVWWGVWDVTGLGCKAQGLSDDVCE